MTLKKYMLASILLIFLFNIGYSAEATGIEITPVGPNNASTIKISPQTTIPFSFSYTHATVSNISCQFYIKGVGLTQTPYGNDSLVLNDTITIIYPNATFTDNIYPTEWEWIVNCSVGCDDYSTWKDMNEWRYFTYNYQTVERDLKDAGLGIGSLLDSIKQPLFGFILFLGIATGVLKIWRSVSAFVGKVMNK